MNELLDDEAYHVMLCFLDNQHFTEKPAEEDNLIFLKNDWWLADTAVIDTIKSANFAIFRTRYSTGYSTVNKSAHIISDH